MKYTMLKDCTCERSFKDLPTMQYVKDKGWKQCSICNGVGKVSAEISGITIYGYVHKDINSAISNDNEFSYVNKTFITSSDFSNNIAKILERIDDAIIEIERVLHIRKENLMSEEEANLQLEIRTLEKAKQLILEMVEVKDD